MVRLISRNYVRKGVGSAVQWEVPGTSSDDKLFDVGR